MRTSLASPSPLSLHIRWPPSLPFSLASEPRCFSCQLHLSGQAAFLSQGLLEISSSWLWRLSKASTSPIAPCTPALEVMHTQHTSPGWPHLLCGCSCFSQLRTPHPMQRWPHPTVWTRTHMSSLALTFQYPTKHQLLWISSSKTKFRNSTYSKASIALMQWCCNWVLA